MTRKPVLAALRQKRRFTCLFLVVCLLLTSAAPLFAAKSDPDSSGDDGQSDQTPEPPKAVPATPTLTPVPTVDLDQKFEKLRKEMADQVRQDKKQFEQLQKNFNDIPLLVSSLKDHLDKTDESVTKLKDAMTDFRSSIDDLEKEIDRVNSEWRKEDAKNVKKVEIENLQDQMRELKVTVTQAASTVRDYQDQIKRDEDQIAGQNDMLTVLKKDVNDLSVEIVRIKKELKDITSPSTKAEKSILDQIVEWPYWGITAAGIGIITFFIAIQPKK